MTAFGWLIGLILPACAAEGAAGLPVPPLMDMNHIERPATPNTFLAGPAGMKPPPDLTTGVRPLPAAALYEKARAVFAGQPRTYVASEFPDQRQVHYVVRSALQNFPDLVTVQVDAAPDDAHAQGPRDADRSTLVVWSRSVYGRSDFGVNRKRTTAWLAALQQSLER